MDPPTLLLLPLWIFYSISVRGKRLYGLDQNIVFTSKNQNTRDSEQEKENRKILVSQELKALEQLFKEGRSLPWDAQLHIYSAGPFYPSVATQILPQQQHPGELWHYADLRGRCDIWFAGSVLPDVSQSQVSWKQAKPQWLLRTEAGEWAGNRQKGEAAGKQGLCTAACLGGWTMRSKNTRWRGTQQSAAFSMAASSWRANWHFVNWGTCFFMSLCYGVSKTTWRLAGSSKIYFRDFRQGEPSRPFVHTVLFADVTEAVSVWSVKYNMIQRKDGSAIHVSVLGRLQQCAMDGLALIHCYLVFIRYIWNNPISK